MYVRTCRKVEAVKLVYKSAITIQKHLLKVKKINISKKFSPSFSQRNVYKCVLRQKNLPMCIHTFV